MMMMIAVHSSWSWRIIFMPFVLPSPVSRELRRKYKFWNWNPSCKKNRTHCVHVTLCTARVRGRIMFTSYFTELLSPARFVLLFCVSTWMRQERWEMMVLFCEKLLLMKSRLELCLNLSLVTRSSVPLSSDTLNFKMNFPCSHSNGLEFLLSLFTAMTEINLSHSSLAPDKSSVDGIRVCLTCA